MNPIKWLKIKFKFKIGVCPQCGHLISKKDTWHKEEYICHGCYTSFPRWVFDSKYKYIKVIYRGKGDFEKNPIKIRWKKKQTQKRKKKKPPRDSSLRYVNIGGRLLANQVQYIMDTPSLGEPTTPEFCWEI